jgi:hypothetical protein
VLSFLSIPGNDGSEQPATEPTSENHLDIAANQSTESAESSSHLQPARSFADVICQSVRTMPFDNKNCTDIAAAVYIENNNKDRRANSFIVSGLPSNKSIADDKRLIESLCNDEFGVSVDLIFVRRI